ncbi:MAG: hypothetical protein HY831_03505 [Candidatus Aenigmarchaeota archaeon]|nr:hypothetical protein [Candidatus Aenigmarchaeota archaeon]
MLWRYIAHRANGNNSIRDDNVGSSVHFDWNAQMFEQTVFNEICSIMFREVRGEEYIEDNPIILWLV